MCYSNETSVTDWHGSAYPDVDLAIWDSTENGKIHTPFHKCYDGHLMCLPRLQGRLLYTSGTGVYGSHPLLVQIEKSVVEASNDTSKTKPHSFFSILSSFLKHLLILMYYSPRYLIPKFPLERIIVDVLLHRCCEAGINLRRKLGCGPLSEPFKRVYWIAVS